MSQEYGVVGQTARSGGRLARHIRADLVRAGLVHST